MAAETLELLRYAGKNSEASQTILENCKGAAEEKECQVNSKLVNAKKLPLFIKT